MLLIWPFVARQLYLRLDPARALIWTILAGYLLLPPVLSINLPGVPDFTKYTIPSLSALLCVWLVLKDRVSFDPGNWVLRLLMLVYVLSAFGTVLTNTDPLIFVLDTIPGMKIYDSLSNVATQIIGLLPFVLARRYLSGDAEMKLMLQALVAAGLVYSLPMLLETVVSPQINVWVYGYFQHDFFQTIRAGGYRPVVFLPHGLWVAFFAMMCVAAAAAIFRALPPEERPRQIVILLYLGFMVLVCKSAGAILLAALAVPLLMFANRRVIVVFAAVVAIVVLIYPVLRGAHLVPLDTILDFAGRISGDRAASLQFRITNEELLLNHAAEKPLFGWGGFNRSFLHDPISGRTTVIADGAWIIILGISGWAGYLASFGLLAAPLIRLGWRALRGGAVVISPFAAALALILAFNLLDMLPNATEIPFTWLMAGALCGYGERLGGRARPASRPKDAPMRVVIG